MSIFRYIIFIDLSASYPLHLGISIRTWKPCKAAWPCHSTSKKTHTFPFSLSSFLFHILTHSLSFSISLSSLTCCPHCVCGHVISHDTPTVCVVMWSHMTPLLHCVCVCGHMISHDPPHCVYGHTNPHDSPHCVCGHIIFHMIYDCVQVRMLKHDKEQMEHRLSQQRPELEARYLDELKRYTWVMQSFRYSLSGVTIIPWIP